MRRPRLGLLLVLGMLAALLPVGAAAPAIAADDHLMLTEIVVTPTGGEFIEIHNPTGSAIDLSDYYLTDATFAGGGTFYYNIVTGANAGGGGFSDFHARFPDSASIGSGEYQTVALNGSDNFFATYAMAPTYELFEDGVGADAVPDMREALSGSINGQGGLSNGGEVVVVYTWDGVSDLVTDVDYAVWGDTAEAVDKTGVPIDGPDADAIATAYAADTAIASQDIMSAVAHASGDSFHRFDMTEGTEVGSGGNGLGGDDETSENTSVTWGIATATPGAAAPEPGLPELVINEIMPSPAAVGDSTGEWFELYNPTASAIDIEGWTIADDGLDSHVIASGGPLAVPAGGYLVLARNGDLALNGGVAADYVYGSDWGLSNSADEVVLLDVSLAEIDSVFYSSSTFPYSSGASMSLTDPALDNNDGANWCESATPFGDGDLGSPGAANSCTPPPPPPPPPPVDIVINEVDADQEGTDSAEFIELYDGGVGSTALDGLSIVLYNGSDDASYLAFDLDGMSTSATGYFVLCGNSANTENCDLDVSPNTNLIQNGQDAVALVVGDAADYPNDTAVSTNGLIDALVYDTDDGDDAGLLVLLNAGQPQVNERDGGDGTGHSNQRCPNGSGGARNTDTYEQFAPTPGAENTCILPPPPPAATPMMIHEVQGSGFVSPVVGVEVIVEGIVVGDFQGNDFAGWQLGGFYVQEESTDWDADESTSEGVFVFAPGGMDVAIGDVVSVTGTVEEFFSRTQIGYVSEVVVVGTADAVGTAVELPVLDESAWEKYEGMLVTFPQDLYITEFWAFGRYGEIVLADERQYQGTHLATPGAAANAISEANELARIVVDDGRTSQNPDPAIHPNGDEFDLENYFRGGDILQNVTGVMDYNFGTYKLQPVHDAGIDVTYINDNPRPSAPDPIDGDIRVASFNVLNFFTHTDDGDDSRCGPSAPHQCRGADNATEYQRQLDKLVAGIIALDADILGIQEIENDVRTDDGDRAHDAVLTLVEELNAIEGDGVWEWAGDAGYYNAYPVRNEVIYRTDAVVLDGSPIALQHDAFDLVRPTGDGLPVGRPPLAATFRPIAENGSKQKFTVVVNHFKSKGSSCADIGDPYVDDGQGNCNLTRAAQSEALLGFVDYLQEETSGVLVIGDLNSYAMEDPITTLEDGGMTELLKRFIGPEAYSYVFDGQLGYLDTALATRSMLNWVKGVTVFHINADEVNIFDYDTSYKKPAQDALYEPFAYRVSDHDPVIIGLSFGGKK